jgi:hypothetical protein
MYFHQAVSSGVRDGNFTDNQGRRIRPVLMVRTYDVKNVIQAGRMDNVFILLEKNCAI